MTREMSNGEILGTIGQMVRTLSEPEPNPDLFKILSDLPLYEPANMTKLLAAAAIAASETMLHAAGLHTDKSRANVFHIDMGFDPGDDVPAWASDAASLMSAAANYQVAPHGQDSNQADGVTLEAHAIATQGSQHSLRVLAEMLGYIRHLNFGIPGGVKL